MSVFLTAHCYRCGCPYGVNGDNVNGSTWQLLRVREQNLLLGQRPQRLQSDGYFNKRWEFCPACANLTMGLTFWPGLVPQAMAYVEAAAELEPNYRIEDWNVKYEFLDVRPGASTKELAAHEKILETAFEMLCHGCGDKALSTGHSLDRPDCRGWQTPRDYSADFIYGGPAKAYYGYCLEGSTPNWNGPGHWSQVLTHQFKFTMDSFSMAVHIGKSKKGRPWGCSFLSPCCGFLLVEKEEESACNVCGKHFSLPAAAGHANLVPNLQSHLASHFGHLVESTLLSLDLANVVADLVSLD